MVLNEQSVAAYEKLMTDPATHGLPFRALSECFMPSETVRPAHLLFADYIQEVPACPKVIFYIVMDMHYAQTKGTAPSGEAGYALEYLKVQDDLKFDEEPIFDPQACRVCGCTEDRACFDVKHGPCWWVEVDLCSHCKAGWNKPQID